MHIALGVQTDSFPIQKFLRTQKTEVEIHTEAWSERHGPASLTFSGNPGRRGGEWRITDQYSHRHPAWTQDVGFPTEFDESAPPHVLVFRVQDKYHARLTTRAELLTLGADAPRRLRSDSKGISRVTPGLLSYFDLPARTLLESFEEQQAEAQAQEIFNPSNIADARHRVFAAILRRQGQQAFRRALLKAYQNKCAITGCEIPWVLEAAHITPYRGPKTNALANGLVLRGDIHTLFDLGLISVEPNTLTIKVSSLLHDTEYSTLDGEPLAQPAKATARPSKAVLQEHYSTFRR